MIKLGFPHFIKFIYILLTSLLVNKVWGEVNYIPPDPFLVTGEVDDSSVAEEISQKISELQNKNKEMRAKIVALQDMLISRFKDRIELKVDVVTAQENEKPQFGIVELSATMNNISIVNYNKPILFEKKMALPIYYGPLPVGNYELKIEAIIGQQKDNWPFVLPQGKWAINKELTIHGSLNDPIQNIKIVLKPDQKSGLPTFVVLKNNKEGQFK